MAKLRWGVLSTASIGRVLIEASRTAAHAEVEGPMYRHHPQTTLARKLVAGGAIGRLAHVLAALSVSVEPGDIRRSPTLGGGALNDLGCYCVSAFRLFAGEPDQVNAIQVRDGPGGVDLVGTDGRLTVPDPWLCRTPTWSCSATATASSSPSNPKAPSTSPRASRPRGS